MTGVFPGVDLIGDLVESAFYAILPGGLCGFVTQVVVVKSVPTARGFGRLVFVIVASTQASMPLLYFQLAGGAHEPVNAPNDAFQSVSASITDAVGMVIGMRVSERTVDPA